MQSRHVSSFLLMLAMLPVWCGLTLWQSAFRAPDLGHLFFTFVVPLLPLTLVFDGCVSSLRTRTADEVLRLVCGANASLRRDGTFALRGPPLAANNGVSDGGGGSERPGGGGVAAAAAAAAAGGEGGGQITGEAEEEEWLFEAGSKALSWPLADMHYFIGTPRRKK
jgi:hypothetical protein